MKIVFCNFTLDENWGGGENWTLYTSCGLSGLLHTVHVVGLNNSRLINKAKSCGLTTFSLNSATDYSLKSITRLFLYFRRVLPDVVVVHHNRDVRTAGVAAKLLSIPVVHRNGFPILRNNIRHRFSSQFTDRILTNSSRIKTTYSSFGWIKPHKIDVIPNGITPPGKTESPSNLPRRAPGSFIALYSGRLTGVKRVSDLIEAWASLPSDSSWQLWIMGKGSEESRLRRLVASRKIESRVLFLGYREDSKIISGCADLLLLPSEEEGMPNSLMEAMIRKTAVAATPVGDVTYLLDDGSCGFLFPVGKPDAIADLLKDLEKNPAKLREISIKGFDRVSSCFTMDKMLSGIEESLYKAIKSDTDYR